MNRRDRVRGTLGDERGTRRRPARPPGHRSRPLDQSGVSRDRTRIRSQIGTKGVHAGFRGSGTSAGTNPGTKIPFAGQVLSIAKLRVGQEAYQLSGVAQSLDDYSVSYTHLTLPTIYSV